MDMGFDQADGVPGGGARTRLDAAYAAHAAAPEAEAPWGAFLERVLDAELFLLLAEESRGDRLRPRVFDLEAGRFALAFDLDARLGAFLEAPAPYAALSGRRLVMLLAGQGVGIGLNPGTAPSSVLLPAATVDWLAAMAADRPVETEGRAAQVTAPGEVAPALLAALGPKLAAMAPLIGAAHLAAAAVGGGTRGLLLGLAGVPEPARSDVAAAVAEAVRFGGLAEGALDVAFVETGAPLAAQLRAVGLALELPRHAPGRPPSSAPGTDPARPPILIRNRDQ